MRPASSTGIDRRGGANNATDGEKQGRGQHGAAQAVVGDEGADRRRGHDRAHQIQGERPADEPQAADVADRCRHGCRRQHRVGGMQPDGEAQHEKPGQVLPRQDLAPADLLAFRPYPGNALQHLVSWRLRPWIELRRAFRLDLQCQAIGYCVLRGVAQPGNRPGHACRAAFLSARTGPPARPCRWPSPGAGDRVRANSRHGKPGGKCPCFAI